MLATHDLTGKSKDEIIKLLGHETENAYFKSNNNFVYYMGNERAFFSIDSEWLVIIFHKNIATAVRIMRD